MKKIYQFQFETNDLRANEEVDDIKQDEYSESAQMFKKQKVKILEVEVKLPELIPEI
jgi:hypothetical protein